jgi:hypothetical protein
VAILQLQVPHVEGLVGIFQASSPALVPDGNLRRELPPAWNQRDPPWPCPKGQRDGFGEYRPSILSLPSEPHGLLMVGTRLGSSSWA